MLHASIFGADETILCRRHLREDGFSVIKPFISMTRKAIDEVAGFAIHALTDFDLDMLFVDEDGLGAGVVDICQGQGFMSVIGINNSWAAIDPTKFANCRAECYWNLAEAVRQRKLYLPPDDAILQQELVPLPFSYTAKGQFLIAPKDKIRARIGRSPDRADSLALTFSDEEYRARNDARTISRIAVA